MVVESFLTFITASLMFIALTSASYYLIAKEYVRFVGQEALICMLEIDQRLACEHEAQARLSWALQASGDGWIALSGEARKRKIARMSFRPYKQSEIKEYVEQTLTLREILR